MSKTGDKEPDFTGDEFWGKGGNYVVDPATGKRKPAPSPQPDAGVSIPAQIGTRPDDAAPGVQIDSQGLAPIAGSAASSADAESATTTKEKRRV